jgi:hypothetical protein
MWSLLDVVSDVSPEHPLEVPTTVDQDVVEALLAHGPEGSAPRMHSPEVRGSAFE